MRVTSRSATTLAGCHHQASCHEHRSTRLSGKAREDNDGDYPARIVAELPPHARPLITDSAVLGGRFPATLRLSGGSPSRPDAVALKPGRVSWRRSANSATRPTPPTVRRTPISSVRPAGLIPGVFVRAPGAQCSTPCPQPTRSGSVGGRFPMVGEWPGYVWRRACLDRLRTTAANRGRHTTADPGRGSDVPACRRLPPMASPSSTRAKHLERPRALVKRGRGGRSAILDDDRKRGRSQRPRSTKSTKTTPPGKPPPQYSDGSSPARTSRARVSPGAPNVVL